MRSRPRSPTTARSTARTRAPTLRRRRPRRRRPRRRTDMAITLTETAARHVAASLAKRGKGIGLRLGVRTSGCSGPAYKLEYADDVRPEDMQFESHGVRVV